MKRLTVRYTQPSLLWRRYGSSNNRPPIMQITNATFYRHHPDSHHVTANSNPALFKNLNFHIPTFTSPSPGYWAILGPSSSGKTTFCQILRGQHLSIPPTARSYPALEDVHVLPNTAIKHVGFDGEQGLGVQTPQSAYLSARYESRREETDFTVHDYLLGNMELNPLQDSGARNFDLSSLERVINDLRLGDLIKMPVLNLSNGQTRRVRIARALLSNPEVLLLDEPFMGLDPPTLLSLSPMLYGLAQKNAPRLVLTLRPQDPIPDWITHLIYLTGSCQVAFQGRKEAVICDLKEHIAGKQTSAVDMRLHIPLQHMHEVGRVLTSQGIEDSFLSQDKEVIEKMGKVTSGSAPSVTKRTLSRDGYELKHGDSPKIGEELVKMEGVCVTYGTKSVLGNWTHGVEGSEKDGLWWSVRRGERWGIFGPNGSGKTTLLSLISSDHPQTYSQPVRLFGQSRIPERGQRGISIFDIQARIGHSSPEIHNHLPKSLTLREVLANAWAGTFRGVPKLDDVANERIDACLNWFGKDLRPEARARLNKESSRNTRPDWADDLLFGGLPFSTQRVAMFLRAVIKQPDLVILDEAFSGMDEGLRDRCLLFLAHGETKEFSMASTTEKAAQIVDSRISKEGRIKLRGLNEDQALLCISHVREEIPGSIREWICLPEANTGNRARFGKLEGPLEGDYRRWNDIWGM